MSDELIHYGIERRSGRYPWGSGKKPQRSMDFKAQLDEYRKQGLTDVQISEKLSMSTTEMRRRIATANEELKAYNYFTAIDMRNSGKTNTQIGQALGMTEGGVRAVLKAGQPVIETQIENIASGLKDRLGQDNYLDIGLGTEIDMGISRGKLLSAVNQLKDEGYYVHEVKVKQISDPSKRTTILVLTNDPDSRNTYMNSDKIKSVDIYTEDGGLNTTLGLKPIKSIDSKRVKIRYAEDGGEDKDGVIEIRQGHKDLDLGAARYAQVRIGVDGSHYLKGMAMYGDIPDGYDIVFNTNKAKGTPKHKVLKEMKMVDGKIDPDNPFGASIKAGGQKGFLNIVNEEGDWSKWTDSLSSQMLSKQPIKLVKDRLDATMDVIDSRISELNKLTNPVVKRHFMEAYADELGSKTRSLKVEAIPRSKNHVLLPFPDMKPNEVYAPNYKNGEKVVLIRHPHGGTFEIPELTVNNKTTKTRGIKNALDAIGIHPSVAHKLSGADFDGDSVIVIPNNNKQIKFSRSLKELKNFDPNKYYVGRKTMGDDQMQTQMGVISNLITDMTIKGASQSELARAVKHSMVVIDAKKHQLDWKQSARDNGIAALNKAYQVHVDPITGKKSKGASTLISKSKRKIDVDGEDAKVFNTRTNRTEIVKKRPILDMVGGDARKLSSGSAVENQYANYINKVTAKRNDLEKIISSTPPQKTNPRARKEYAPEIKSLQSKVDRALSNAPRERQAQLMATKTYYDKLDYNMGKEDKKRLKSQALAGARARVNSNRSKVIVTDREWKAIQMGAVSNNLLQKVLLYGDQDQLIKLASPPKPKVMSAAKLMRAKAMLAKGNTQADVAKALGISTSTLRNELM